MKCGKTDLCDVLEIKGKYQVTWGRHVTALNVYDEKAFILIDMIINDLKGMEVGVVISGDRVAWFSLALMATLDSRTMVDYLRKVGDVKQPNDIKGAVFDNLVDVETFIDRLEKKFIVYLLKK